MPVSLLKLMQNRILDFSILGQRVSQSNKKNEECNIKIYQIFKLWNLRWNLVRFKLICSGTSSVNSTNGWSDDLSLFIWTWQTEQEKLTNIPIHHYFIAQISTSTSSHLPKQSIEQWFIWPKYHFIKTQLNMYQWNKIYLNINHFITIQLNNRCIHHMLPHCPCLLHSSHWSKLWVLEDNFLKPCQLSFPDPNHN